MNDTRSESVDIRWQFDALPQFAHTKPRYAIGVSYSQIDACIHASLVRALGRGIHLVCDVIDECHSELDKESCSVINHDTHFREISIEQIARLKADLAESCANLVRPLLAHSRRNYDEALVIGLHGLGLWMDDRVSGCLFEPLCNSSILAEATGITVVDDFPARDLAHAGHGGPSNILSDWILVGDRSGIPGVRNRGILRLEDSFRLNVIPNRNSRELPESYVAIDIHPGMNLINGIARLCNVPSSQLLAPTFAVQGKVIHQLLDEWRQTAPPATAWSHCQKLDRTFVEILKRRQQPTGFNVRDIMATSIQFLGENTADKILTSIPDSMPISELVLVGSLQADGTFIRQLNKKLSQFRILPLAQLLSLSGLDAPAAAIMALARIDQLIGNAYRSSKVKIPRCLGRITPGNPKNWERVSLELYSQLTSKLRLKEAV